MGPCRGTVLAGLAAACFGFAAVPARAASEFFWPATTRTFSSGTRPEAVAIADVNGDGRNDVVVTTAGSTNHSLRLYLQTPSGELATAPVIHSVISNPLSLDVGDLDGDGRTDVIVGSSPVPDPYNGGHPRLTIFRQNASGALEVAKVYINVNARRIAIGDFNSDGLMDVVGADPSFASVDVFLQNADRTWADPVTYGGLLFGSPPPQVAVGDVNGDGRDDVVLPNGLTAAEDHVVVLLQTAQGTLADPVYQYLPRSHGALAVGDVTGDDRDDVVLGHWDPGPGESLIGVLAQNSSGAFDLPASVATDDSIEALVLGDVNGDSRQDILAAHRSRLGIYLQNGLGGLSPEMIESPTAPGSINREALAFGDINSDGQPDVVLADDYYGLLVILKHRLPHELALLLTASAQRVAVGARLEYTSTVSNHGTHPMTGVTVTFQVPHPFSYVSAGPASTCESSAGVVTCALDGIAPGAERHATVVVGAPRRRAAGAYVIRADVRATELEFDSSNNSATTSTVVVAPCAPAIADGGFEARHPPAEPWFDWTSSWPGALCNDWTCPSVTTAGPRTGAAWLWLGGEPATYDLVTQSVLVRPGSPALLRFHVWNGEVSESGTGVLRVLIDRSPVWELAEGQSAYASGYAEVTVDLSAKLSDGWTHELGFESYSGWPGATSFSVDDVTLEVPYSHRQRTHRRPCR
jgi:uncharacterized repeat protein (TIGR01451 family)